jgi:predicted ATPase
MLERIEIENLGSIEKTAVSLGPLTALVGANASGKTTVMRGIELFAELRSRELPRVRYARHSLGGAKWSVLLHGGDETRQLVFRAFVSVDSAAPDYELRLGVNWERVQANIVAHPSPEPIEPEFLFERLRDPRGAWLQANEDSYSIRSLYIGSPTPRRISITQLVKRYGELPQLRDGWADLLQFVDSFGEARYFRPNGAAILAFHPGGRVRPSGEGFVTALAALQNRVSERFDAIEKNLRQLFPHIRRIRFDVRGAAKVSQLLFETERSTQLTPADMEADGVLTTLFLLWAGATTPPHGTLLIDEPETALHPHLMGKRVEFLRSLANGHFTGYPLRVVVATQSVDFVRWLEPAEVRVVEYSRETGTLVHELPESETLRTLIEKFQANLGDLWYSGTLGGIPGTGA